MSQNISNLECSIFKLCYQVMCNILRPGPVPRFSDLEVIALSMAAESEEMDSENCLFELMNCPRLVCMTSITSKISGRFIMTATYLETKVTSVQRYN